MKIKPNFKDLFLIKNRSLKDNRGYFKELIRENVINKKFPFLVMSFSKKNVIRLKIFTSSVSLLFFLILFYFGFIMVEEAFTKNYSTGTVWDPPLWIPYSSMMLGALLMILQYIAEIIKLTDEEDFK